MAELLDVGTATSMQARLRAQGFFFGLVDGVWGPRSRIALRDFKTHNGLPANDAWDLATQELLVAGGKSAPDNYSPPEPGLSVQGLYSRFPAPVGTTMHPLNLADAKNLQKRLYVFGYYRGLGEGVWGPSLEMRSATLRTRTGYRRTTPGMRSLKAPSGMLIRCWLSTRRLENGPRT